MIGIFGSAPISSGGVYQYTLSLIESLVNFGKRYDYTILLGGEEIIGQFPDNVRELSMPKPNFSLKLKRFLYAETGVKFGDVRGPYKALADIDLIISPVITFKPIYMDKPFLITIHDLQHKYYPEFFSKKEMRLRDYKYGKLAKLARRVICESRFVEEDVHRYLKIPYEKIRILQSPHPSYLKRLVQGDGAHEKGLEVKERYRLPRGYLFYPAQFWNHKNHVTLVRAISHIKDVFSEEVPLVLVGGKEKNYENTMREIQRLDLSEQVFYLGYVPAEDMPYIYKLATCLVLPTLFESISLPVWEAFDLGVPVVSSDVCALPEQIGDSGVFFDPKSEEDMAEKIYLVWKDEALRKELVWKGQKRVEGLSQGRYAGQWEEVIGEVLES